jgi:histone-lysine N-methyltransferase SETD3
MLNHARVHPTEWSYNQQRQGFVITAKSDIDKGTEIYDTYGRKLNRVFYSNYGFLEDGNDLNVADIHTCLSARDSLYHFKLRLINQKVPFLFIDRLASTFESRTQRQINNSSRR